MVFFHALKFWREKLKISVILYFLGLENGISLGTPIGFLILNQNTIKTDYSAFDDIPRPGHADYTYLEKYGIKTESGGGKLIK